MLILINNGPSPYGRKVMVALREKGLEHELQWDVPWHSDSVVPEHNPLEQLPILISEDGEAIYDSSFILDWLEVVYPEPSLSPDTSEGRLAVGRLRVLSNGLMAALALANFELSRPEDRRSGQWLARQIRKINGSLHALDRIIGVGPFAVADRFTLADIEVGCVVGQLDFIAKNIPPLRHFFEEHVDWRSSCLELSAYIDRLMERESFRSTLPFPVEMDFDSVTA